jgi:hypothetical protein
MKLKLSPTQSLALRLLHDPQIVEVLFGGGAGGSKSFLVCIWMVSSFAVLRPWKTGLRNHRTNGTLIV